MEQHDDEETTPTTYPLGRGYGHDYMRGGEVFGGYGYRDREEYARTRGGDLPDGDLEPLHEIEAEAAGGARRGVAVAERPEDAAAEEPPRDAAPAGPDDAAPPVPHLEHTFGDTGSAWRHSRSYYVTQAQLQQRIYGPQRYGHGPYQERLRTLQRDDADLQRDVAEALFFDTWVDAARITVDVTDGIVTLRGELASHEEVRFACDDAWSVAGVRGVRSELTADEVGAVRS